MGVLNDRPIGNPRISPKVLRTGVKKVEKPLKLLVSAEVRYPLNGVQLRTAVATKCRKVKNTPQKGVFLTSALHGIRASWILSGQAQLYNTVYSTYILQFVHNINYKNLKFFRPNNPAHPCSLNQISLTR